MMDGSYDMLFESFSVCNCMFVVTVEYGMLQQT